MYPAVLPSLLSRLARIVIAAGALCLAGASRAASAKAAAAEGTGASFKNAFSLDGHTAYHLRTARLEASGGRALVSATFDGTVLAHTPEGRLLWQRKANGYFPYDVAIADIDHDGRDEIFVATAGGTVDALSPDGRHLWSFATPDHSILYQVCPVQIRPREWRIFTGGISTEIYALSDSGQLVQRIPAIDTVRLMRKGNIRGDGREYLAVTTTTGARSGVLSLLLIDPVEMKPLWRKNNLGKLSAGQFRRRFFSMLVQDVNQDGADEIVLSGGNDENGIVYAFGREGQQLFVHWDERVPNTSYRMNLLRPVRLPDDEFILGHFGNILILYNLDGTCREVIHGKYAMADAWFDPELRTLFLGSTVEGGDDIYAFRLDQPDWKEKFKALEPVGKLAKIQTNLKTLQAQLDRFKPPAYQPAPRHVDILAQRPGKTYRNLDFVDVVTFTQKIESREETWCKKIDIRRPYNLTADQIVAATAAREQTGKDFLIWAGHGTAMHFPLSTFERVVKAAPRHLKGFILAEMEAVDEPMQRVVQEIVRPLADFCREHGKIIIFRNKNVFWNGTCYLPFWKEIFSGGHYRDVIIPGTEDTNDRTHEMNLAGRIGLWQTGHFDRWLGRATTDQGTFDKMNEWCAQQVITHHLRNLVIAAVNGADIYYITLDISDLSFETEQDVSPQYQQLAPFYQMLEKGVLQIPRRDQLLSLSGIVVGLKSPPDRDYLAHGVNGHLYKWEPAKQVPMVFDRLDGYWGGAPLAEHDFSSYAYGVERRMLNFLPKTPFGMVPIVPDDIDAKENPRVKETIVTDGRWFYENGRAIAPADYKRTALAQLEHAAARLPVRVRGDVAWNVVRLDPRHVRVTLIDPGYVDPAVRSVEVAIQHLEATKCTDILTGETLPIRDRRVHAIVPAGVFTVLDIEHR